ncbi:MAG: TetR/AcrR family transcriptional regulator [Actinomycetota bacterium]|nr:TetR/AcrR family transcriptional regulator [Rubrobacteraceae bacterium]MDQ3181942.1 TetR/AcrR family transcriptional regulator [Actinomycetota bacterium]MDQ3496404.1 TetR/AcrR family transcriptional regulator [Actinomycetota bacterium]
MVATSEELGPRAAAKRDQILSGARRVFLRDGFAAASTDAIAAEARVSKRTLYVYYSSKEELFADVMRKLTIENPQIRALETIEEMSPGSEDELRRDLLGLARKIVAAMMQPDYLALLRTTIADTHRFPQLGGIYRATVPERGMRSIAFFIEKSRERGVVGPEVDGDTAARMFVGPLLTYAVLDGLLTEGPPRPPAREKIEEIVDLYMKAIT